MSPVAAVEPDAYGDAPSAARETLVGLTALVVLGLVGYGLWLGFEISNLHNGLFALAYAAVGLYVLRMRPDNVVAKLFVVSAVQSAVMFFGRQYALHDDPLPGADWLAWLSIWQVPLGMGVAGLAILVFPTGTLLSPRWRVPAVGSIVVAVVLAAFSALWPLEDDWRGGDLHFPFEVGGYDTAYDVLWPTMMVGYQAFLLLWVVAVVVRIRRAEGDETRQLRWFVSAVALSTAVLITGQVLVGSPVPGLIATTLVPVAAGVAILKYRLYDIDPVINKAIVVAALVLVITAGYVGIVLGIGAVVPVSDGVLSLVATALVAVAFEPVRRRAQRVADRLVYGHRATPYEALAQLSSHLVAAPEALLDGIAATVAGAVGATEVVVWVGDMEEMVPAAGWPEPRAARGPQPFVALGGAREHVRPVVHQDSLRGALTLRKPAGESLTAGERQLLDDLVAQTGLVIDHRSKEQEIRAAARRIVAAGDAARRSVERDLHDGAQQRLVALSIQLAVLAERADAARVDDVAQLATDARAQLLEATAELRELARGLHPPALTRDGLQAAVEGLVDRASVPVRLSIELDTRPPPEVEATAYFLVAEALTNVTRYSGATSARVLIATTPAGLSVRVADDGRGGADPARGSGLRGLSDRLAAMGAELDVDSPVGAGTTVGSVIPCV